MFGFDVGLPDPELQQPSRAAELLSRTWIAQVLKDAASGVGAFGDAAAGRVPVTAGLRREDFTDDPGPGLDSPDSTVVGRALGVRPIAEQPVDPWVKAAADAGAFAMTGGAGGVPAGAVGSTIRRPKGGALPMDDASRLARARAQGYDVDTPIYHGSPTFREGMEFDLNHPARTDTGYLGSGVYSTPQRWLADVYARPNTRGPKGETVSMYAKKGKYKDVVYDENYAKNLNSIADELGVKARFVEGTGPEAQAWSREFGKALRDAGYDGARGINMDGTVAEMVTYNPANLRSVNAKFDPANDGKAILLGSGSTDKRSAAIVGGAQAARELEARPTGENLRDLIQANFNHAVVEGDKTVPLSMLKGGTGPSKTDADRVKKLREAMDGPDGYIERLVVDDAGNVIEGQHRLEALRARGEKKVPVTMVRDLTRGFDYDAAQAALNAFQMHPDRKHQLLGRVFETLRQEKGNLAAARDWEVPGFDKQFNAVLDALEKAKR